MKVEEDDPMDEKKFDDLMDRWASMEMESAPDVRPRPGVYRHLRESQGKRGRRIPWTIRLAAVGLAGAAVVLFIVVRPPGGAGPPVGLRRGSSGEEGKGRAALQETRKPAGEAAEPAPAAPAVRQENKAVRLDEDLKGGDVKKVSSLARAVFEFRLKNEGISKEIDVAAPEEEIPVLTAEDSYRLSVELSEESHVYIFQTGSRRSLVRLFPNKDYSAEKNPLLPGRTLVIPAPPDWFFVRKGGDTVTIYIVTMSGPGQGWDAVIGRHAGAEQTGGKDMIPEMQVDEFRRLWETPRENVSVREFRFRVR